MLAANDPLQFSPLTLDNVRENLPRIIQQMFTYDLQSLKAYGRMMHRLYAPQATFHYPLALLRGREAVCQFWHSFLIGRAFQHNDVHSLRVDMIWDTERLQAFVQVRCSSGHPWQQVCCRAAGSPRHRHCWLQCRKPYPRCAARSLRLGSTSSLWRGLTN